jgi:hypothetical protein
MKRQRGKSLLCALLVLGVVAGTSYMLHAEGPSLPQSGLESPRLPGSQLAVGSWFGRAIPAPGKTVCTPGSAGCAVPTEIIMVFTIMADGNFIGIDSNIFQGGTHSTAHGQWVPRGYGVVHATFTLLQETGTLFIGGFKNIFDATLSDANNMTGTIQAYLYLYTDSNGNAIVNPATGLPTPNPLTPPSLCATTPGCVPLGEFTFIAQRVEVEQ